ncbi:MAG TPA: serine/threonine-protein kinase [Gemmatimonadales bacterium]|nr:serine/threonine-protein kinase [Gemmatimonadales bacterium]
METAASADQPRADRSLDGPDVAAPVHERLSASLASLTGQVLDQRYQINRKLGEGGMSYVYQAQEIGTDKQVAVKILIPRLSRDPASVERLRREATIATRLNHPNVCPILRMGETSEGLIYLVMPYLEGEPLSEHEARRGPFPVAEGIPLLIQVCRGLGHAHELQIIHRDLKPENVMLVPDPSEQTGFRAVVMDFGLAKERRAGPDVVKLTATGIVLGTPEFMSPEQIRGKPLDGRSDVYALAILAFELFTGQLPFTGKSAQETMIARLRGAPMPLRAVRGELPVKLEAVISKALSVNPADRYGSMAEMAHALESVTNIGVLGRLFGR